MSQELLKKDVSNLERKLVLLLDKYKAMKSEVAFLNEQNSELKSLLRSKAEQLEHFQNQIKISKIANGSDADGDVELKKKIDDYIKEIDKCIMHLSR